MDPGRDDFWGNPTEWMARDGMRSEVMDLGSHDYEAEKRRRHQAMLMREVEAAEDVARRARQELHEMRKGLTPVLRDERRWLQDSDVDGTRDKYGRPWGHPPPGYGMGLHAPSRTAGDDVSKPATDDDQTPLLGYTKPTDAGRLMSEDFGRSGMRSTRRGDRDSCTFSDGQADWWEDPLGTSMGHAGLPASHSGVRPDDHDKMPAASPGKAGNPFHTAVDVEQGYPQERSSPAAAAVGHGRPRSAASDYSEATATSVWAPSQPWDGHEGQAEVNQNYAGRVRSSFVEQQRLDRAEFETREAMDQLQRVLSGHGGGQHRSDGLSRAPTAPPRAPPGFGHLLAMQDPWEYALQQGRNTLPGLPDQAAWREVLQARDRETAAREAVDDEVASLTEGAPLQRRPHPSPLRGWEPQLRQQLQQQQPHPHKQQHPGVSGFVSTAHLNHHGMGQPRRLGMDAQTGWDDHHLEQAPQQEYPESHRDGLGQLRFQHERHQAGLVGAQTVHGHDHSSMERSARQYGEVPEVHAAAYQPSVQRGDARSTGRAEHQPVLRHGDVPSAYSRQAGQVEFRAAAPLDDRDHPNLGFEQAPVRWDHPGVGRLHRHRQEMVSPRGPMAVTPATVRPQPVHQGQSHFAGHAVSSGRRDVDVGALYPRNAIDEMGLHQDSRHSAFHAPTPLELDQSRRPWTEEQHGPAHSSPRRYPPIRGPQDLANQTGSSEGRRGAPKKAATYDGKSSFADYQVQFELVAELNQWSAHEMGLELATNLRGPAQAVLSDLEPGQRYIYSVLVKALMARFEPEDQAELYRAQLRNRYRKPKEDLNTLSAEIKRLVRKAYPKAGLETKEKLARDSFIDSLNDAPMELAVHQGHGSTLEAAVRMAIEYEAFCEGRKNRHSMRGNVRAQKLEAGNASISEQSEKVSSESGEKKTKKGLCFSCKKPGHWKRECPERKEKSKGKVNQGKGTDPVQKPEASDPKVSEN